MITRRSISNLVNRVVALVGGNVPGVFRFEELSNDGGDVTRAGAPLQNVGVIAVIQRKRDARVGGNVARLDTARLDGDVLALARNHEPDRH